MVPEPPPDEEKVLFIFLFATNLIYVWVVPEPPPEEKKVLFISLFATVYCWGSNSGPSALKL